MQHLMHNEVECRRLYANWLYMVGHSNCLSCLQLEPVNSSQFQSIPDRGVQTVACYLYGLYIKRIGKFKKCSVGTRIPSPSIA